MAIKKEITFEGLTYTLNDQARLAASAVVDQSNTYSGDNTSTGVQTLIVDTVDATTKFKVGNKVYKSDATLFGTLTAVTATLFTKQNPLALTVSA